MKIVLTIAGSDSSGGAGIQADVQAIAAQGLHGATAITAITSQSPRRVHRVDPVAVAVLRAQLAAVGEMSLSAIKTGMLATAELVDVVADFVESHLPLPLVVDPVLVSSSGHPLLEPDGVARFVERLMPLASVLTPNIPEASALLGHPVNGLDEAAAAAQELVAMGPGAVVLKGGHRPEGPVVDLLWDGDRIYRFDCPRVQGMSVHGTGCVHASTLAALLAKGEPLPRAVAGTQQHLRFGIDGARVLGDRRAVEPRP